MKRIYYKLKYFFEKFNFLRVYNSPFKRPKMKWYFGSIALGTPYFLPRTWWKGCSFPKKIGFDFVPLGWKTKYGEYRFEWAPRWSLVLFRKQLAITWYAVEPDHYWECWLYYRYETNSKEVVERIKEAREKYPCVWVQYEGKGRKRKICYWDLILKEKYL